MTPSESKDKTKPTKQKTVTPAEAEELKIGEVPSKVKEQAEQSTSKKQEAEPFGEKRKDTKDEYSERERKLWQSIVRNASIYSIVKLLKDAPEYEPLAIELIKHEYGEEELKHYEEAKSALW